MKMVWGSETRMAGSKALDRDGGLEARKFRGSAPLTDPVGVVARCYDFSRGGSSIGRGHGLQYGQR